MYMCWDFKNIYNLNAWDNIKYGKDGEQNWILEASFVELFTILKDLSQIIRD